MVAALADLRIAAAHHENMIADFRRLNRGNVTHVYTPEKSPKV